MAEGGLKIDQINEATGKEKGKVEEQELLDFIKNNQNKEAYIKTINTTNDLSKISGLEDSLTSVGNTVAEQLTNKTETELNSMSSIPITINGTATTLTKEDCAKILQTYGTLLRGLKMTQKPDEYSTGKNILADYDTQYTFGPQMIELINDIAGFVPVNKNDNNKFHQPIVEGHVSFKAPVTADDVAEQEDTHIEPTANMIDMPNEPINLSAQNTPVAGNEKAVEGTQITYGKENGIRGSYKEIPGLISAKISSGSKLDIVPATSPNKILMEDQTLTNFMKLKNKDSFITDSEYFLYVIKNYESLKGNTDINKKINDQIRDYVDKENNNPNYPNLKLRKDLSGITLQTNAKGEYYFDIPVANLKDGDPGISSIHLYPKTADNTIANPVVNEGEIKTPAMLTAEAIMNRKGTYAYSITHDPNDHLLNYSLIAATLKKFPEDILLENGTKKIPTKTVIQKDKQIYSVKEVTDDSITLTVKKKDPTDAATKEGDITITRMADKDAKDGYKFMVGRDVKTIPTKSKEETIEENPDLLQKGYA